MQSSHGVSSSGGLGDSQMNPELEKTETLLDFSGMSPDKAASDYKKILEILKPAEPWRKAE